MLVATCQFINPVDVAGITAVQVWPLCGLSRSSPPLTPSLNSTLIHISFTIHFKQILISLSPLDTKNLIYAHCFELTSISAILELTELFPSVVTTNKWLWMFKDFTGLLFIAIATCQEINT